MRREFLIFALLVVSLTACAKSVSETKPQNAKPAQTASAAVSPAATPVVPKDGVYPAKGEVTKINTELGSIELKHEEIPGLMPAMQMEFFVKDKAALKDLKVGDKVDFTVEYKHPTEVITSIKKTS